MTWETVGEVDVVGFRVERSSREGAPWKAIGVLIPARGNAAGGARYVVMDSPGVGAFRYRVEVVGAADAPQNFGPVETVVRALRAFLPALWLAR